MVWVTPLGKIVASSFPNPNTVKQNLKAITTTASEPRLLLECCQIDIWTVQKHHLLIYAKPLM